MIYFDNAATTLIKPDCVINAVTKALTTAGNGSRGLNKASISTSHMIFETRQLIAEMINVDDPSNIAFTLNSTMALNTALFGTVNKGDYIITTSTEHNSVLRPCYLLKEKGAKLIFIKADINGKIDYNDFVFEINKIQNKIKNNNKIVIVVNHSSNVTGDVLDIDLIGDIAKKNNCIFIVDASQSMGLLNIDVIKSNIDILCFTGHKSLYGPQGTGGLYVNPKITVRPLVVGGSGVQTYNKEHPIDMPTHLEAGTLNAHGIIGLNAALKFFKNKREKLYKHDNDLRLYFYNKIRSIDGIKIYGNQEMKIHTPVVAINIKDIDSGIIGMYLNEKYNISTRTGGHCAPLMHKSLKTDKQGVVRFSFGYFNTKDEIDICIKALKKYIKNNC